MNKKTLNRKAFEGDLSVEEVLSYYGKKVKNNETGEIYTIEGIDNAYEATVDLGNENGTKLGVWVGELELI